MQRYVAPECIDEKWQYQVIQSSRNFIPGSSMYIHVCERGLRLAEKAFQFVEKLRYKHTYKKHSYKETCSVVNNIRVL